MGSSTNNFRVFSTLKRTYPLSMGDYDKDGNYRNSGKDKWIISAVILVILVTAMIAGQDGGGYSIPSNEP